jgi:thiamine biosynthesis lipoprotein
MEMKFRAMNTDITVMMDHAPQQVNGIDQIQQLFQTMESIASRFSTDSELSRLNAAFVNTPFLLTQQLYDLLVDAWEYALLSDFKFNPFIGSVLKKIGYDRSFEKLENVEQVFAAAVRFGVAQMSERVDANTLSFSSDHRSVTKHQRVDIDLGGIGKGWTVDLVQQLLQEKFQVHTGVIDAGGDMRVWSDGLPWQVGIQDPIDEDKELVQLWIKRGGIATSNVVFRRWIHDGFVYHHIIDGHTMQVASSDIIQATVLGPSTAQAEVVSKVICMLPASEVNDWVSSHFEGVGYIFVTKDGEIKLNREVEHYVEELHW